MKSGLRMTPRLPSNGEPRIESVRAEVTLFEGRNSSRIVVKTGWRLPLRGARPWVPASGQILPLRVHLPNQNKLLAAAPPLDLFFPCDSVTNVAESLKINKAIKIVSACEARNLFLPMFEDAPLNVVCHTGVKHPRFIRKNVNKIGPHSEGNLLPRSPSQCTPGLSS